MPLGSGIKPVRPLHEEHVLGGSIENGPKIAIETEVAVFDAVEDYLPVGVGHLPRGAGQQGEHRHARK